MTTQALAIQDLYELSPMQQGMLFHTLYAPKTGIYFEQRHCLLEGTLEPQAFMQAWQQVCDRYDVLRSEFHWENTDKPLQVVYQKVKLPWTEGDWRDVSSAQQSKRLEQFLIADRLQGFQLDRGPLMRCALFQLTDRQYRFVWSYHHLLMDGWCNGVLIREVLAIYRAIRQQAQSSLPPVKPYRDYIIWLQQQDRSASETYWRNVLQGFESPTPLGIDRQSTGHAAEGAEHGEQQNFLSADLSQELQTFAKQSRLTLNTLLQGAWAVVLSRYSGLEDVLFGITVSGRPPELSGVASMVGLFINTVPLRVGLSEASAVLPWLQTLQQAQRDRETYSYSLLTDVQSWSNVPSGTPLFESLLIFENYPISIEAATQNLDTELLLKDGHGYEQTNYPLAIVVIPGDQIQLSLRYDAQRIPEPAATRLLGHLETVLINFIKDPAQQLSQVSLLTQAERQQLNQFSQGGIIEVSSDCIPQQFEMKVLESPDAPAIAFSPDISKSYINVESVRLSYQQLNQRANQIAHYLAMQGVKKGSHVGLCLDRSVDMVASLLATLKVGGTYIPLDPSHPAKRLTHIATDAQIELLISTTSIVEKLSNRAFTSIVCLDEKADVIGSQSSENLSPVASTEDIAYILYTSGSTGQPKGVLIRHRSLTNFLASMAQLSGIKASDTLLAVTTLGFDIAALEIFLPLVTGAQIVMTPREVTLDGTQLAAQLAMHNVTLMQATPATWRILLEASWQGSRELKILCGGEALDFALAQQLLSCGYELWNLYGPTETTIWSGALKIDGERLKQGSVPIGAPMENTQFYVLDEQRRQVPIGVAGELYIGGVGLSPGYWNREDLTAERFVDGLYKTGDRVRYREDGTLDYLGRLDNQIKLRGFRIELGAIETCLTQHLDVVQAIVIAPQGNNPQLIAYVTLKGETRAALKNELQRLISQQLPAYMVPVSYQVLEAFPLTPNGKVDRRALQTLSSTFDIKSTATLPPRTPHEKLTAGIWADVLGADDISLNDNFFELGGHSLLATRVISQVRQTFDVEVPLRSLFEQPTLSAFVSSIQQIQSQRSPQPLLPPISPNSKLVLSYAQQRQWLMTQLDPNSPAYNIPIAIRLKGDLSIEALRKSIGQVVSRHNTLRTIYPSVDGKAIPVILIAEDSLEDLTTVDFSHLEKKSQRDEVTKTIRQQAQQPFDLAQGPLWRSQLLRLGDREHILLLTLHHIITDGWSMGVLLKELTAFYQAAQAEKDLSNVLPPLPIRYSDYAAWGRSLDLSHQQTYWKQQLSGIAPLLDLPTDYARPAEPASTGASYEFRLSQTETAALQQFSQRHKATLFMTLLAAFKTLLYRYSGLGDIAIGTPIANRQQSELEGLIGLFVNTIVIRSKIENNPRFSDFLTQIRSTTLEAYSHQDLPFEQLVDKLEIPRSLSHTPLVQVMFALQNQSLESSSLANSGLAWTPLAVESTTAKFDITLDIKETPRGLVGRWEYRSDLFSADTIHRMAGHFRTLLKALPNSDEMRLSELPMLSSGEKEQLQSWQKGTGNQSSATESIAQLFEAQAAATPETIALVQLQTQLTYQTLNQRANQLAHYLRQQGVELETPVGLWAKKSPETLIAILAILKAGGTYVPLDPHYPVERLAWIVKDTQITLLITSESDTNIPTEIKSLVPTVEPNDITRKVAGEIARQPTGNLFISPSAQPRSLAYIIYTSGSTGQPKGVCVTHQGVTRLIKSPNYVTLTTNDVILQAAPLTFDASTFEIWGALLNGGKLVLLPDESPSLEELGNTISTHHITTLWLTSGLFNLMVDEQLTSLKSVRQLLAGGDVLSVSHLRKATQALKNTRIINGYGPTEGTTFTCCHTITERDLGSAVPIGKVLGHTQVYVLDADLQQVPVGVPGELYIGGAGVARGYLNQPALTAERFIPNPFYNIRQQAESRFYLYKTGDRVRYRTDGALEYLGRLDRQVKVRGFRMEPGEIEAALESYPDIQQAAVVVSGDGAEQKRLVAYIETVSEVAPLELRQFLREILPDYMVPAKFVQLEAMPLTVNGKVDRTSLPAPQWNVEGRLARPQTAIEQTLVEIFSSLLPADAVNIHDNFFELGGDSILAMQIVSKAGQAGLKISPKQLFQHQTVAELATVTQQEKQTTISQLPATGEVPLTPIQQWFFEQNLAVPEHFNQSILLELPDEFDRDALETAIAHIYNYHDALRLQFTPTENGWQQKFSDAATPLAIGWFDFSQMPADEQERALAEPLQERITQQIQTLQASLNLPEGPLMGISIFDLGTAKPSQLFITIHHLVIDGVSWRILLADLQRAYQQAAADKAIQLAPKTHSYQQWAQELVQAANSPDVETDFDYWRAIAKPLQGRIAQSQSSQIPQDKAEGENTIGRSQTISTALSAELTRSLLQDVPPVYNTQITEALLTAFTQTLTQWTKNTTTLIDLESYGRFSDRLNLSRTVGWFTALYPVSLPFEATQPIGNNFKAIKSYLRAVPSQGMSYGLLRYMNQRHSDEQQALTVTPPISFNYLGQLDAIDQGAFRRVAVPDSNSSIEQAIEQGANQAAANNRSHLLDVNSWIENKQLQVQWTFSRNYHERETIEQLAAQFITNLSALIEHCCAKEGADYAPDDFGLLQLDQSALDSVLSQVSFAISEPEVK